jgi:hypothetical protein
LRIAERLVGNGVIYGWEGSLGPNNQKQKGFAPQHWEVERGATPDCLSIAYRWREVSELMDAFKFTLAFNISVK